MRVGRGKRTLCPRLGLGILGCRTMCGQMFIPLGLCVGLWMESSGYGVCVRLLSLVHGSLTAFPTLHAT